MQRTFLLVLGLLAHANPVMTGRGDVARMRKGVDTIEVGAAGNLKEKLEEKLESKSIGHHLAQKQPECPGKPGYAIWIVPKDAKDSIVLKGVIAALSKKFTTNTGNAAKDFTPPMFDAHLTLFGMIYGGDRYAIIKAFKKLATKIKGFDIEFTSVTAGGSYWQTVYLGASHEEGANPGAVQANKQLADGFKAMRGVKVETFNPVWTPHMSLMYHKCGAATGSYACTQEDRDSMANGARATTKEVVDEDKTFTMAVDKMQLWYLDLQDETTDCWEQVAEASFEG